MTRDPDLREKRANNWLSGLTDPQIAIVTRRTAILRGLRILGATALADVSVSGITACRRSETKIPGELLLEARQEKIDLGSGRSGSAWLYGGKLPGPELRFKEGARVRARLINSVNADTSIHWHGIPQKGSNSMDGVPGVTQPPVQPGQEFVYDFLAAPAGTYLYHSHFGLQIEHGLYGPLIIEPAKESMLYDREYVLMFDDWPADVPERMLANLVAGRPPIPGMNAPMAGMESGPLSSSGTSIAPMKANGVSNVASVVAEEGPDVPYSTFLVNGKPPSDPIILRTRRGDRIRLRLINAGAATGFRVSLAGHRLLVTHADGASVNPVLVDALEFAPGERYDVFVVADNPGVWELQASSVDEPTRAARAVLRYDESASATVKPAGAPRKEDVLLRYADLSSIEEAPWSSRPDRVIEIPLRGQMVPYSWWMGERPSPAPTIGVRAGELVQVRMKNESPMRHPMHLHGHNFRLRSGSTAKGPTLLKDTASVEPGATLEFQFRADNPGRWLFHCHHAYHQEVGMMSVLKYLSR